MPLSGSKEAAFFLIDKFYQAVRSFYEHSNYTYRFYPYICSIKQNNYGKYLE